MRILLVNKFARVTGGADRHCLLLAAALRADGHEVSFFSTAGAENEEQTGRFVPAAVTHETRDAIAGFARARVAAAAVWNKEVADAMAAELATFRPHVVHTHKLYPQLSVAPVVVAVRAGVPVVQTLHDYEFLAADPFNHAGGLVDRDEHRTSYRALNTVTYAIRRRFHSPRVSAWIAVSEFVARLHRARGVRPHVIENFTSAVERAGLPPFGERAGVIFVGRLTPHKGGLDVLEIARALPEIPFTVVGSGRLQETIRRDAQSLSNVNVVGRLGAGRVQELMRLNRVAAMPYRWQEPGGLAMLEAFANGTPVVAYPSGGLAECIEATGAGEITPPDPAAFARMCAELHTDEARWRALSETGLRAVETRYTAERYLRQITPVYESVAR